MILCEFVTDNDIKARLHGSALRAAVFKQLNLQQPLGFQHPGPSPWASLHKAGSKTLLQGLPTTRFAPNEIPFAWAAVLQAPRSYDSCDPRPTRSEGGCEGGSKAPQRPNFASNDRATAPDPQFSTGINRLAHQEVRSPKGLLRLDTCPSPQLAKSPNYCDFFILFPWCLEISLWSILWAYRNYIKTLVNFYCFICNTAQ